jgi:predicted N-acetyltransferase YhbS
MWSIYQHTRGMYYLRVGTALHSESLEPLEVYRTLYDNELSPMWVRPQGMFHEEVVPGHKRFTLRGSVRVATKSDDAVILPFGFDAWGEGRSEREFVENYQQDKNHLRGVRYLFELPGGEIVANVNTLRFRDRVIGLASLSVKPQHRGQGYGSVLIRAVMELFRLENPEIRFILYSEVGVAMYERLGFLALPDSAQYHRPSVAMATGAFSLSQAEVDCFKEYF